MGTRSRLLNSGRGNGRHHSGIAAWPKAIPEKPSQATTAIDRTCKVTRNHTYNVFVGDLSFRLVQLVLRAHLAQAFAFLALFLRVEASFLEFVIGDSGFHSVDDEMNTFLHFRDVLG